MQEQRKHPRVPVVIPLSCEIEGSASFYAAATDISLRGARIQCASPPEVGTKVTIVVHLPGASGQSRLPATVRWTEPGMFGVQFGALGVQDTCWMANLMGRSARAARRP
jgi:hypothetical protein